MASGSTHSKQTSSQRHDSSSLSGDEAETAAAESTGAPESPPERSALIRKTPFVAYTIAAIATIYILARPESVGDLLVPTVVAGLVFAIGYMTWSELRG